MAEAKPPGPLGAIPIPAPAPGVFRPPPPPPPRSGAVPGPVGIQNPPGSQPTTPGAPGRPPTPPQPNLPPNLATKAIWRPTWTPTITNPISCNPFASSAFGEPAVDGIGVFGAKFEATGVVDPDSTIQQSDFELGILQAVIQSKMEAVYVDAANTPTWTLTISESSLPIRDSENDDPVWVKKNAFKLLNVAGGKSVHMEDRPRNVVPWQTKDKKGTLASSSGADIFSTWLAARQKSTQKFIILCWAVWSIDWGCTFDFKTQTGASNGVGNIHGQGTDGEGPFSPITGGKIANKEVTLSWTGPPGGF